MTGVVPWLCTRRIIDREADVLVVTVIGCESGE